jgi:putative von willebrand factor type A domain protein
MKKTMTLLPYLRKSYAKGTLQMLAVMCLLGTGVVNTSAQTRETSEKVTSNLHERVKLMRSVNGGTLKLFLAAELPSRVEREHWPIVFVSRTNAAGEEIQVMQNLVGTEEFVLDIAAAKNNVSVSGEDGLWTVDANNQSISGIELTTPSLRYLQLSHNEVKTGAAAGEFVLPGSPNLGKLEHLDLSFNKLLKLNLAAGSSTLKQVVANGNGLTEGDYSALTKLTYMNLQGNRLEKIKVPAAFVANAEIFDVSRLAGVNNYEDPYKEDLANQTTYGSKYDHRFFADHEGELNLSVNKLKISTLPSVPQGIDVEKRVLASGKYKRPMFNVAAQERLGFDKEVYALKEAIDLSSEATATRNGAPHNTTYTWYIEEEAGTDKYLPIPEEDYDVENGVTRFKRGFGRKANIFAVLRNKAFDTPLADPNDATQQLDLGLSSFEAAASAGNPLNGYLYTTEQPSGNVYTNLSTNATEQQEVGGFSVVSNKTSVKSKIEDAPNALRHLSEYRTKVISLKGNYWYGFENNNWADPKNWTMRYVPETTPAQYAALADKSEADVEFATSDPAQYGSDAIRDLHTDVDRVIEKYINKSTTKKALVVQASHKLNIKNAVDVTKDGGNDLPELLRVKAGDDTTPNASLYVDSKAPVNATVELYAKSSNQGSGLQRANWQYFGAPVGGTYNTKKNVFGSALVRKYDRTLAIANSDEKWVALNDGDVVEPGAGYEVATPTPTRFEFKGALKYGNKQISGEDAFEFALDGAATGTNYNDINILANPFTAAMNIAKIQKNQNPTNIVETVYLFNTGSRENWLAQNGANTPGNQPGQYTQAIPIGLTGVLPSLPTEIPSLSSFAVKANGSSSIYYLYKDLDKVATPNRARRMDSAPRVASLTVDVASENSMDRLWLVEHEDATENFDNGLDGEKMLTAGAAQLYVEGAQNLQVSTTRHLTRANLSFIPADKAERYELKFHLDGFNASDEFVLLDKRTGAETKINDGDKYSFIADRNDKRQRFAILRKGASLDNAAQAGFTVMADATRNIEVLNETTESGEVIIVDAAGKSLARFTLAAGARKNVQVNVPGVYVVKAENTQSRFSQSVLVP